jgi:Tol biopolymer transport system component
MKARSLHTDQVHPRIIRIASFMAIGALALSLYAAKSVDAPVTARVSLSASGAQGDRDSIGPAISADGRYIAFVSWASNVVPNDFNNYGDIFVRDLQTGTIVRATVSGDGADANGQSCAPTISGDGRYVAFVSEASNLVLGDTNDLADVFVRDLVQGTTVRISVASNGVQANAESANPAISSDGRFVAFESRASNLCANDTNGDQDVFVRDLVSCTTERVSVASNGEQAVGDSQTPSISADGRFVAFETAAANLASSPPDTNKMWDVLVRDRTNGTTVRASLTFQGAEPNGNSTSSSISADGRYVAFESKATNLVAADSNGRADVFVRDLQNGSTVRASVDSADTQGNQASAHPSISADGRFLAFTSKASNLVSVDTNSAQDVFLHDR